jgi:YesN/AraC family two-component response regulator
VQLRRVTSFVHEYLHEDVSLMQMAEEAKLSPAYFSQCSANRRELLRTNLF